MKQTKRGQSPLNDDQIILRLTLSQLSNNNGGRTWVVHLIEKIDYIIDLLPLNSIPRYIGIGIGIPYQNRDTFFSILSIVFFFTRSSGGNSSTIGNLCLFIIITNTPFSGRLSLSRDPHTIFD